MKMHGFTVRPNWLHVTVLLAILAVHGFILQFVSSHFALSATAVAGLVVLLVLKHTGLLASVLAWVGRKREK